MARLGDTLSAFIAQQELSLLYSDTSFASEVEGECLTNPPPVNLQLELEPVFVLVNNTAECGGCGRG